MGVLHRRQRGVASAGREGIVVSQAAAGLSTMHGGPRCAVLDENSCELTDVPREAMRYNSSGKSAHAALHTTKPRAKPPTEIGGELPVSFRKSLRLGRGLLIILSVSFLAGKVRVR